MDYNRGVWRAATALMIATVMGCSDDGCPDPIASPYDDPRSDEQWYLGSIDALGLEATEGDEVLVAVLDNAVELAHPDLVGRWWNDEDGHHGYDFLHADHDVQLAPGGGNNHGTACAGIIAATRNNGVGIAGLCAACRVMMLVGRDFAHTNSVLPVLGQAVDFAVANGVRVLSISDGALPSQLSDSELEEIRLAMQRAEQGGMLVVASAGNDGRAVVRQPAAQATVLAVAAMGNDGQPASFTSFGPEVDVMAPGECVPAPAPGGGYQRFAGTSAAAPIAASLAALVVQRHPDWSPAEVRARIVATAKPIEVSGALVGGVGAGMLSFAAALR